MKNAHMMDGMTIDKAIILKIRRPLDEPVEILLISSFYRHIVDFDDIRLNISLPVLGSEKHEI